MPQLVDRLLLFEVLVVDQLEQLVVLAAVEHKDQGLLVHQVLEEDLKAEIGGQVFLLLLQQLEEVLLELLLFV